MKAAGTQHLIERVYRESGKYQWVRELFFNGVEAGATRIQFGVEFQAVESKGVYRRLIADNGCGMSANDLVAFFNTFGGGGKPIGGEHENFGVGSKTSLLPWNKYGLVVVSRFQGVDSMIWVQCDPDTGEYGLKLFECEDPDTGETTLEVACDPHEDPEHGCDWRKVIPDWVGEHGSVIVLLGNSPTDDTVRGDPNRDEAEIKGISSYLNRRIWKIPEDTQVTVDEFRTEARSSWPMTETMAHGTHNGAGSDRRLNSRRIVGAQSYVEYSSKSFRKGSIQASGTVTLDDTTEVDWVLWEGERPAIQSYAAISGFIATLYKNELYDVTTHHATYRSFGISESAVRKNLWLIIRPPAFDEEKGFGVYPRTDRNALLLRGGPNAGGPLPLHDWAGEFADKMPQQIVDAIRTARSGRSGTIEDEAWRRRLAERFGARWKIKKRRVDKGGDMTVDARQSGTTSKPKKKRKKRRRSRSRGRGGTTGTNAVGSSDGNQKAKIVELGGGIPRYRAVGGEEFDEGMLAAWQPNDPVHAEGAVLINIDHPVLQEETKYWQDQFADHHAEDIAQDVIDVYGQAAVAKVAHSEQLKSVLPSKRVEDELRSEGALTMALLGLMGEEAVLGPKLRAKYRRRRAS